MSSIIIWQNGLLVSLFSNVQLTADAALDDYIMSNTKQQQKTTDKRKLWIY